MACSDIPPYLPSDLEDRIQEIGLRLLAAARAHRTSRLSRRFWSDQLMQWAMKDPAFKVQLFRFVDVFPMLRRPEQIQEHLQDYLAQPGVSAPMALSLGLKAGSLFRRSLADTVASQIVAMAGKFILADDVQAAPAPVAGVPLARHDMQHRPAGRGLPQRCRSRRPTQRRYLALIDTLAREAQAWPVDVALDADPFGPIPRANVSVKISSLSARIKPADSKGSIQRLIEALTPDPRGRCPE